MELVEATYIACMLCVHAIRRAGALSFEEKLHILECVFFLVNKSRYRMYTCTTRPALVYTPE